MYRTYPHRRMLSVLIIVMIGVLSGCGQKGDLYLPPEQDASNG